MAGSVSGESWSFTLTASHAREINAIFADVEQDRRNALRPVELVERAIQRYLNEPSVSESKPAPEAEAASVRQSSRVRHINVLSGKLVELLGEYIHETDDDGFDGDGLLDTLPGLLLLNAHPGLREEINNPRPSWGDPELSDHAASAFTLALEQVQSVQSASQAWLNGRRRRGRGALPGDQVVLVTELYGAVYSVLMFNRPLLEKWEQRPAAPKGPLCRLCEIAWEALGRKPETNMPQLVRRSLAYDQAFKDQAAAYIDAWQAHFEQKCTPGSCDFCSG